MMKILITGAEGFIGKWLCKELSGYEIIKLDCDIRDYQKVKETILKVNPDAIINLAGISNPKTVKENEEESYKINVLGAKNVLEAGKKAERIIIISSALVYKPGVSLRETGEIDYKNDHPYIQQKIEIEKLARGHNNSIIIRPFNQEGPERPNEYFTSMIINNILKDKEIEVWDPNSKRDILDVRDGVKGIKTILLKGSLGQVYNLCSGKGYSKLELIKIVSNILNKETKIKLQDTKKTDYIGDNSKLKELGWLPKISIEETLKDQFNIINISNNDYH